MLTQDQINECRQEYLSTEMGDLSTQHLKSERLQLYGKWFSKLLDHALGFDNPPWLEVIGSTPLVKYIYVQDEDSHWYKIPEEEKSDFYKWVEYSKMYWDILPDDDFEVFMNMKGYQGRMDCSDYRVDGGPEQNG